MALHSDTICGMEMALSAHSDGISTLEREVATLKSRLKSTTQMNEKLQLAVEDLVSRSKRQNVRVTGIPEGVEGHDACLFMTTLFSKITGGALLNSNLELDSAHHSLGPKPPQGSWPFRVVQWAKKNRNIPYQGYPIRIFEDYSAMVAKKRGHFQ